MREQLGQFWQSQTSRLTAFYLAIIMVMTLSFSVATYFSAASQFDRRVPGAALRNEQGELQTIPQQVRQMMEQYALEGKQELVLRLGILNIIVLVFGLALSYMLARKTLEPIERNVELQTRFVSDVSHELRTPLTSMKLTNEVALRQKTLSISEAREVLQGNLEDIERLQRLTTRSLDLVSDEVAIAPEVVAARELIETAVHMIQHKAQERQVALHNQAGDELLSVDSSAVVQALVGILDNAIKYSQASSDVNITTQKPRWGMVRICVKDSGVGIAKKDQEKIFERFYRSDEARLHEADGGYGLGLSIARKLVEAHGGTIELRSELGKGSTFILVLPEGKAVRSVKKSTKKPSPKTRRTQ